MTPASRMPTYAALVAVQVFFGLHYHAAKTLVREVPAEAWAAVRGVAGAVFLFALALVLRRPLPRRATAWLALAGLSVLGVVINQYLFIKGLSFTEPQHSALINSNIPVLTLGFAVLFGREKVSTWKVTSLVVGLVGVLILLEVETLSFDLGNRILLGDLLTLCNATSFSLFLVLSKPVLEELDSVGSSAVLFLFGALGLLVVGGPSLLTVDPGSLSSTAWLLALYIVVFPTAGAYLLQFFALRRVESSLVALFIYLQFVIAAGVGSLLGQRAGTRVLVAAAFVLAALMIRGWEGQRRAGRREG